MESEDYNYCEGHGVRVQLGWIMPDLDEPILLGQNRLPPIARNFVPKRQQGLQGRFTIDYVLARATELEEKSEALLRKYRLN